MKPTKRFTPTRAFLLSLAIAGANSALAQQSEEEVEEVVVTGTFIRNSQFSNSSPIEVISTDDIWESGASNLGEYLRDLPYMENIDVVANTLDAQDGQQDSNSARFNLRGLGVESTLTLLDGTRTVNEGAVAGLLPSIAQREVQIVADGGAAYYGADAVAGVANIIPYKEFEGLRMRTYYKRDEPGDTEQSTFEAMTGASFAGINWVGAIEYRTRTALNASERPRFLAIADQDTAANNPGSWVNADFFGTTPFGSTYKLDPGCGEFNDGAEDLGQVGSFPSGDPSGTRRSCTGQFGEWQDFARPSVNYTMFNNFTYSPTDWLDLEFQMGHNYRESQLIFSPSSQTSTANRDHLIVPENHPANPFDQAVKPYFWRPYAKAGTAPSHLEGSGFTRVPFPYYTDSYRLAADYRIGDTSWQGTSYLGYQQYRRRTDSQYFSLSRMEAALNGQGGPSADEWYNPFGSADPRSPDYVAGVTDNSQELMDWLILDNYWETNRNRMKFFETVFDGEVMEIPTGTILAAVGFQIRHIRDWDYNNPADVARDDVSSDITAFINPIEARDSGVRSIFAEVEVPLFTGTAMGDLGFKAAGRYEDFYTLGYETTKPKVSLIWELTDDLSFRASYGESFLAPSPSQLRPALLENCTPIPDDDPDPITGQSMEGLPSCLSGNPSLNAEESDLWNLGFTWEPLDGMSISLDYQEIEYYDKIDTLVSDEVTGVQFADFLAASGFTEETYDTLNPDHVAQGIAYVLANPSPLVKRDGAGTVTDIIRAPYNFATQWVEGFDFRSRYSFSLEDLGRFTVSLNGNYYTTWEYQQSQNSAIVDAKGFSNSNTGFAPPIADWKANLGLSWVRGNHSAGITTRYIDEMEFDETTVTPGYSAADYLYVEAISKTDARYTYRFNAAGSSGRVTVGVTNLFDREAQRLPIRNGLETRVDDPFGRQFYMSLDLDMNAPWN